MFAYGVNFKVRETMLLYPKHLVDLDDRLALGEGDELIWLEMRSLNLGFDGGYGEYVDELRQRIGRC